MASLRPSAVDIPKRAPQDPERRGRDHGRQLVLERFEAGGEGRRLKSREGPAQLKLEREAPLDGAPGAGGDQRQRVRGQGRRGDDEGPLSHRERDQGVSQYVGPRQLGEAIRGSSGELGVGRQWPPKQGHQRGGQASTALAIKRGRLQEGRVEGPASGPQAQLRPSQLLGRNQTVVNERLPRGCGHVVLRGYANISPATSEDPPECPRWDPSPRAWVGRE